jgi:hypothetical protein
MAVVAAAVALAAPAGADQDDYLRAMRAQYVFLTDQQLLAEAAKICHATRSGTPASDAVIMVSRDFGIAIPAAGEIVSSAIVNLGC